MELGKTGDSVGCPRTRTSNSAETAGGFRGTSCSSSKCLGRFRSQDPLTKRSAKQRCQKSDKKKCRACLKNCWTLSDSQSSPSIFDREGRKVTLGFRHLAAKVTVPIPPVRGLPPRAPHEHTSACGWGKAAGPSPVAGWIVLLHRAFQLHLLSDILTLQTRKLPIFILPAACRDLG